MARLYVFELTTLAVVAIIEGPDGVSCEHAAGQADSAGKQPYCSPELGWQYDCVKLVGVDEAPVIQAAQLDVSAEVGTLGGPHKMTQAQLDVRVAHDASEHQELAAKYGLKIK